MPMNVKLETDLPSPGPTISVNQNQIQQVLTNLVTNAREAIGEDRGSIHVGVRTIAQANIPRLNRQPVDWQSRTAPTLAWK